MSIFQKIKRVFGMHESMEEPDADIDEIMAVMNSKPVADTRQSIEKVALKTEGDVNAVIEKLAGNKIIIVDISPLIMQRETLKKLVKILTEACERMRGQICRISNEMIIVTPSNIRISAGI